MAERRQVEELLRRVQELSDAISAPSTSSNVDAEVSRAFRPIGTASGNLGNSREVSVLPASAATSTSSSQSPRFAFRRNFSNDGSRVFLRKSKAKTAIPKGPFLRDLVLLGGPDDTFVPRQGLKLILIEHGHIISAAQFDKSMSEIDVEVVIKEAFEEKIPPLVDFEILMSVGSRLVKPNLAPGQRGINGVILHRLFKDKPVYVRPNQQLIQEELSSIQKLQSKEIEDEDDDDLKSMLEGEGD